METSRARSQRAQKRPDGRQTRPRNHGRGQARRTLTPTSTRACMSPWRRPEKLPSTKDTIERAIKKGAGIGEEKINYETVVYEGFAPHKVPVVVECLTDNRNRTAPEIRNLFKAGSLGQPGSVAFFFNHLGVVEATHHGCRSRRGIRRHRSRRTGNRGAGSRRNS